MVSYRWKYVMDTKNSCIYVDYAKKVTKIVGTKRVYYYKGVYPNIDYNTRRVYKL